MQFIKTRHVLLWRSFGAQICVINLRNKKKKNTKLTFGKPYDLAGSFDLERVFSLN